MIDIKQLFNQMSQQRNKNSNVGGGLVGGLLGRGMGGGLGGGGLGGGLAGGLIASLLGRKGGRGIAGNGLAMGGIAALGGLAYKAWQNYQQGISSTAASSTTTASRSEMQVPPSESGFIPRPDDEAGQTALGMLLLRAMIAASKVDGQIDTNESQLIFDEINRLSLDSHEKGLLLEEYSRPTNLDALVAGVTSPQQASEVYAASALIIGDATPAEQHYLETLAQRLQLAPGLTQQLRTLIDQSR